MQGAEFHFPFNPYHVQLMTAVYGALCDGSVGIFESPTGTGKSLSIICSSLRWLKENPVYVPQDDAEKITAEDEDLPQWVLDHAKKKAQRERQRQVEMEKERLNDARKRMAEEGKARARHAKSSRPNPVDAFKQKLPGNGKKPGGEDDKLVLSEDEEGGNSLARTVLEELLAEDRRREDPFGLGREDEMDCRKIIYCSRTHSQLSQFMREVRRTTWGQGLKAVALASRKGMCINDKVSKLKSAVRINAACLDLQRDKGDNSNQEPTDAASAGKQKKALSSCAFLDDDKRLDLRDEVLAEVQDIEDVVQRGKKISACPYYASRAAIKAAELVTLPYTSLVHKGTREALGVSLKGNVVVIDEAHNFIDAVSTVHSAVLSLAAVQQLAALFAAYLERFGTRLSPKNTVSLRQVIRLLKAFATFMEPFDARKPPVLQTASSNPASSSTHAPAATAAAPPRTPAASRSESAAAPSGSTPPTAQKGGVSEEKAREKRAGADAGLGRVMSVAEFCVLSGADNIDLFEVLRYFDKSKVLQKLHGYYERRLQESRAAGALDDEELADSQASVVQPLYTFIQCLTDVHEDGRVAVYRDEATGRVRLSYQLLNASSHFREVLDAAHAVVLIGGTMQPMADYVQQLMPNVAANRLRMLSVGHVIPDSAILPLSLSSGPTGLKFDFRHGRRSGTDMLDELARLMTNLCTVVPDGVVLFLPSYGYEQEVWEHWSKRGFLEQIQRKKKVLREPRSSADIDQVLEEYAQHIERNFAPQSTPSSSSKPSSSSSSSASSSASASAAAPLPRRTGALLLCVVGGKLSEGINFSDGLGRCVVVAGLPFPNAADPQLKEKIKYIESLPSPPDLPMMDGEALLLQPPSHTPDSAHSATPSASAPSAHARTAAGEGAASVEAPASQQGRAAGGGGGGAGAAGAAGVRAGQEYYQNLCLKAVNQCIGRAIRHAGDYAAIVLVDERYESERIRSKIAGWIRSRLQRSAPTAFGPCYQQLSGFFRGKQELQAKAERERRDRSLLAGPAAAGCVAGIAAGISG